MKKLTLKDTRHKFKESNTRVVDQIKKNFKKKLENMKKKNPTKIKDCSFALFIYLFGFKKFLI